MQLANQASRLSPALAANSLSSGIASFIFSVTLFSKYGHVCFQKNKMATAKIETWGFKTAVQKNIGQHHGCYVQYLYSQCLPPAATLLRFLQ